MKLVFFGTPDFAVPSLCALHESHHEVLGVVTNPDKKSGRGRKFQSSPVKITAEKYGYPIFQPKDLRNNDFVSQIKQIKSDIYVVVAFKILPEMILKIPQKGAVNLHASLLPMFRGAAPINHAILNGETKTGVTTFQIRQSVDTGDILLQDIISLNNSITAGEVYNELAQTGAVLLVKTMDGLDQGSIFPKKQKDETATLVPKISIDDCRINWNNPAKIIHNQIRAFSPKPGAFTFLKGKRVKLFNSKELKNKENPVLKPGEIKYLKPDLLVGTGTNTIQINQIQFEGRKILPVSQFISGYHKIIGERFD